MSVARIAVASAAYHIDKPYDYEIPDDLADRAMVGMRVLVPFGIGNRKSEGVILSLASQSSYENLKAIDSLLDDVAVLSEENIKLAIWMSDRFFCTVFDALRVMLPTGMWFKNGVRRMSDKTVNVIALNVSSEEAKDLANKRQARSPRQAAVIRLLAETSVMSVKDVCYITESSTASIKALEKQGIVTISEHEILRRPTMTILPKSDNITLNAEQCAVLNELIPMMRARKPEAALLFGVTGSGKTLVYIKLIEEALAIGKTAIVLVPEIALTPQVVGVFSSYFGESVAVLHSGLGIGERYDEWKRIRAGVVRVVVGTRSAVFAPIKDLGLIVIDEEQEHTYKSESNPRYHAREVAKHRVTRAGGLLLLSSATPSVDSMYCARNGKYKLLQIEKRYNEMELPQVIIADMRDELRIGNGGSISSILRNEIEKCIEKDEQSILFINRRGTNPLVACGECGHTFVCSRCSISMTYHSSNRHLLCHYCGLTIPIYESCPQCEGKLKFIGAGTQKVESELLELFPGIGIIRMDADTVSRKNSHDRLLSRFRDGQAHILLGTQMVTKGLDFENVTLVGVVSADSMLYMSDYRAQERTFSLITQVVGRSGRGEKSGRAVIQTYTPNHEVLLMASKQDYESFYEREIAIRKTLSNPPVRDLLSLTAVGINEADTVAACTRLRTALEAYFSGEKGIMLMGPAPAPILKVKNKYRYRLHVGCENTKTVRDTIAHAIREFVRDKRGRDVLVFADSDAYD